MGSQETPVLANSGQNGRKKEVLEELGGEASDTASFQGQCAPE